MSSPQTAETLTSGEESSGKRAQATGYVVRIVKYLSSHTGQSAVTPADTRESSEIRDTESEVSGLGDMISNLQSLRRELDSDDASTDTPTGEAGTDEGRTLETGELRRRTGN